MSAATRPVFAAKYAVERVLGEGGMGVVMLARHSRLGHPVAIKILGRALRDVPELVARFEREALAAGALSSPHAVRVFDVDTTDDGTPFIVMEALEGCDLGRLLADEGPQPIALAARWILEACDAIAEAHALGIVHRDLKPSNLFLARQPDGRVVVKVLDFGVAKMVRRGVRSDLTHAVAPLGTPQYMSPEQVRCARDVDARTDVWSLGVTLHELVTGETPFAHEEPSACIAAIAADPVPDPRSFGVPMPDAFAALLLRALAKDPAARFANVSELARALAPFARASDEEVSQIIVVRPPAPVPTPTPPPAPKRRRWPLAVAFAFAASAIALPRWIDDDVPLATVTPLHVDPPNVSVPVPVPDPATATTPTTTTASPRTTTSDLRRVVTAARPTLRVLPDARVHGGLSGPGF